VAKQLLEGIGYMHSHFVIHRDLKVENVLIVRSCKAPEPISCELHDVKIADFGLSKFLSQAGQRRDQMSTVGTLDYLAPEVMTRQYSIAIDFWSFGVVLYMMLCGRYPFYICNLEDVQKITAENMDMGSSWQRVSENGKSLVKGLLTVDPAARLDLAGCQRHPWLRVPPEEAAAARAAQCALAQEAEAQALAASPPDVASGSSESIRDEASHRTVTKTLLLEGPPDEITPQGVVQSITGAFGSAVDSVHLHLRDGAALSFGGQGGTAYREWRLQPDELILVVMQEERGSFLGNSLALLTSLCQVILLQGVDARNRVRFVAPVRCQIVGLQFQGCDLIGVHLQPTPEEGEPGAVERIGGSVGSAVDRVALHMRDGSCRSYGGSGGSRQVPQTFSQGEFIVAVEQARRFAYLGNAIAFYTSEGRVISFTGMAAARCRRFSVRRGRQVCGLAFEGSRLASVMTCPASGDLSAVESFSFED